MYKQILCPVDGSPSSNKGMIEAIQLAKDQHAKLQFLHIVDTYSPLLEGFGGFSVGYVEDILRKHGKKVLKKAETAASKAGVIAESKLLETLGARVSKFILNQANEWPADLIVMGTHGLRGIERLVMGSDAETVVRNSTTPVLLVKKQTTVKAKPPKKI